MSAKNEHKIEMLHAQVRESKLPQALKDSLWDVLELAREVKGENGDAVQALLIRDVQRDLRLPDLIDERVKKRVEIHASQCIGSTGRVAALRAWVQAVKPALWPAAFLGAAVSATGNLPAIIDAVKALAK